ncbi:MAG: Crp/Fnr family transcriptional regulator [Rhodospirillales bacterium]|nr:Crp/Fnr family transcriptional regulator [Rhodospirillales bacterium]
MAPGVKSKHAAILSRNRLLGQLQPHEMDELLALASVERFEAQDVVFNKGDRGDRLYAILKGRVGINTVSRDGKEIFLNILDAGEVFGEIALLDGKERTAGAVAMESTELLKIGRSEFLPFLERHPRLCIRLMAVLCERLRWTSDIIEDTIFLDIPRRLAKRLLTLAQRHGESEDGGVKIRIKLSQEALAQMLGATRESVNKGVKALQECGAISYESGYMIVQDLDLLRDLIGEEASGFGE